jgi:hypothetical protein
MPTPEGLPPPEGLLQGRGGAKPSDDAKPSGGGADTTIDAMRVGVFDHFGWAVAVTASADHEVVDRRRIELIEPGLPAAPIHYVVGQAMRLLGERADEVLQGPRATLGPPWTKDHPDRPRRHDCRRLTAAPVEMVRGHGRSNTRPNACRLSM